MQKESRVRSTRPFTCEGTAEPPRNQYTPLFFRLVCSCAVFSEQGIACHLLAPPCLTMRGKAARRGESNCGTVQPDTARRISSKCRARRIISTKCSHSGVAPRVARILRASSECGTSAQRSQDWLDCPSNRSSKDLDCQSA